MPIKTISSILKTSILINALRQVNEKALLPNRIMISKLKTSHCIAFAPILGQYIFKPPTKSS